MLFTCVNAFEPLNVWLGNLTGHHLEENMCDVHEINNQIK